MTRARWLRVGAVLVAGAGAIAPAAALPAIAQESPREDVLLDIETLPATPGLRLTSNGRLHRTDRRGRARITIKATQAESLRRGDALAGVRILPTQPAPGVRAELSRWYGVSQVGSRHLQAKATLDIFYLVQPRFVDLRDRPVDPKLVSSVTLKSRHGVRTVFRGAAPLWLQGVRVVPLARSLETKTIDYTIERALVDGTNVVNRAQQRFLPQRQRTVAIRLLFYSAKFIARDALFRFPIGSGVKLTLPSGQVLRRDFKSGGEVLLPALPRGEYKVSVAGPGFSFSRPVAVSRNQVVELNVLSYLDILVVFAAVGGLAGWLLFARRPALLARARLMLRSRPAWPPRSGAARPRRARVATAPISVDDGERAGGNGRARPVAPTSEMWRVHARLEGESAHVYERRRRAAIRWFLQTHGPATASGLVDALDIPEPVETVSADLRALSQMGLVARTGLNSYAWTSVGDGRRSRDVGRVDHEPYVAERYDRGHATRSETVAVAPSVPAPVDTAVEPNGEVRYPPAPVPRRPGMDSDLAAWTRYRYLEALFAVVEGGDAPEHVYDRLERLIGQP